MTNQRTLLIAIAAALIGVAGAFVGQKAVIDYGARQVGKETRHEFAGGDAYPYMFVDKADLEAESDELALWIGSAGGELQRISIWFSPAEANRNAKDERYWSMPQYKAGWSLLYPDGPVKFGKTIKAGDYIIEMSAPNGTVVEHLTIDAEAKTQTIALTRGIKTLAVPPEAK